MRYVLFEDFSHFDLYPFTITRPVYNLRIGIDTIQEKWKRLLSTDLGLSCKDILAEKFFVPVPEGDTVFINSKVIPTKSFIENYIKKINHEEGILLSENEVLIFRTDTWNKESLFNKILTIDDVEGFKIKFHNYVSSNPDELIIIRKPYHLFRLNGSMIKKDFSEIVINPEQKYDDKHTILYNPGNIHIGDNLSIKASILNAENGPIYIGNNVIIEEGSVIKGPVAICDNSQLNIGAKLRGETTIGPSCKVGGEISNTLFWGNSNKAHDGFIGNSVVGEWCNLGAGTNTSNLKNNYSNIKIWNYRSESFENTGLQFCGLLMGDFSKCSINTMFNTGTVVGVAANIFGGDFPPKFVPSFSWGGSHGFETYQIEQMLITAEKVMKRRNKELSTADKNMLNIIYEITQKYGTGVSIKI